MGTDRNSLYQLLLVSIFAVAFAFVEASIVVYLRALYYPEGLTFPLQMIDEKHLAVELVREAATIVMLVTVGMIAGKKAWERIGYFFVAFGLWDIFYYVWLKVTLDWPRTLTDWDVLFLIPVPWIAPMIAPVLLALLISACGVVMVIRLKKGLPFKPGMISWLLVLIATFLVLYSFMYESGAILRGGSPSPYPYGFLVVSMALYLIAFFVACHPHRRDKISRSTLLQRLPGAVSRKEVCMTAYLFLEGALVKNPPQGFVFARNLHTLLFPFQRFL